MSVCLSVCLSTRFNSIVGQKWDPTTPSVEQKWDLGLHYKNDLRSLLEDIVVKNDFVSHKCNNGRNNDLFMFLTMVL
jgi:hypothetical protein